MTINLHIKHTNLEVDLRLPGRGINAIIGSSGAGKTTLLRAIAGLEKEARGRVGINEAIWQDDAKNIFVPTYHRPLGFVFQEASLFWHLSVQENIEFGLRRVAATDKKIALGQAIELLGIAPLLNRFPETLSGGESQRVAIARALATTPELLLMDEPLASLDEQRKAEILPYLERLHDELDIPVLYVSHASDEVARLADHVVWLESGKVRAVGSVSEIFMRADIPFARGEQTSAIISAKVVAQDASYFLTQVDFGGGQLWLTQCHAAIGDTVRLRIQARDVSLTLQPQLGSSILNTLPMRISAMRDEAAGLQLIELENAGTHLLARVTNKSAEQLNLAVGMAIFAQVKGVAILK